ncbi:MAG: hypothetical protein ABI705_00370 [Aestuariivirga sp.]
MARMQFKAKLGLARKEFERSLLLVGDTPAAFEALRATVSIFEARDSRARLILSSSEPDVLAWLRNEFPSARVIPLPFSNRLSTGLFLRRLNVRAAAFVESGNRSISRRLLASFERRAIGVVTLSARGKEFLPTGGLLPTASEAVVVVGDGPGIRTWADKERHLTNVETVDMLAAMLARDLKALREGSVLERIASRVPLRIACSHRWRDVIKWRVRRYHDERELKERLKYPKIILCLGNGPSSEDPILGNVKYDALFRVNHSWIKRKVLANPDVVFTGGRPTMRAVRGSIFGLPTSDSEERLMLVRVYRPLAGRIEFFNVGEVTASLRKFDGGHLRPTNGANMLAAAIALEPEKLVVAGIDLFQHPDGSYPGDASTPNAYSPGHSRETELNYILQLFSEFRGEIAIIGDVLHLAWNAYKNDRNMT